MFNKDVTAYTLGYTFLTPIWGPSTQIRIFNFWNYLLFLHQRRFKTVTKTARSLRTGKGIVSSVVATTYESINRMRSTAKCINPRLSSTLFRVCNGYLFIYFLHSCLNLYELSANSLVINMFLLYCSFPVPLVTCSASIYWKYNILLNQWRQCFNYVPIQLSRLRSHCRTWVIIRFKLCSEYAQRVKIIWKRLIGVHICMLDGAWDWAWDYILLTCCVGKRCLLCAGSTDPPKPSGWYRKYMWNRTIEEMSANRKTLTSL